MPKIEVIPAINAESFEEIKKKIKQVEAHSKWVHLDVADGTFTLNTLWHNAANLLTFETSLFIEVHLMISDIDTRWKNWIVPKVNRVIFHEEAAHDPMLVLQKIKEFGKEVGVAIRPETDWEKLKKFLDKADFVQTLAVTPGLTGTEFKPEILDKIRHIREEQSKAIIEVDGGVNLETGRQCVQSGANILVAANYIFNAPDIKKAIEELKFL